MVNLLKVVINSYSQVLYSLLLIVIRVQFGIVSPTTEDLCKAANMFIMACIV